RDTEGDGIADAVTAEIGAHAGLAGAERLCVGVPARHPEFTPYGRKIVLCDAEEVDALAAGYLDHPRAVLLGNLRYPSQLRGRRNAAVYSWDDGKRAVILDVGVNAIVDEPSIALILVVPPPHHPEQRGQRGLDGGIVAAAQGVQHRAHTPKPAAANLGNELGFAERYRFDIAVVGRCLIAAEDGSHRLELRTASAASRSGTRLRAELIQGASGGKQLDQ